MSRKDKYGVKWKLPKNELCPTCGQPDSVGECNHKPLSGENIEILGGIELPHQLWNGVINPTTKNK